MPKSPEPTVIISIKRELVPVMDTLKAVFRKLESIEDLLKKVHKELLKSNAHSPTQNKENE